MTKTGLRAAVLVAMAAVLAGCKSVSPAVQLEPVSIQRLGMDTAEYLAPLRVSNPNDYALQVRDVRWTLSAAGGELVSGHVLREGDLPARKDTTINLYITLPGHVLDRVGLADRRQFDYSLTGCMELVGPLGPVKVSFAGDGRMPIVRPLAVTLVSIAPIGTTDTRAGLAMEALISNPNDLTLTPCQLTGKLAINDRPLIDLEVDLSKSPAIAPHGSVRLRIPMWVTSAEVGSRTLGKMLAAADSQYRLTGSISFRPPGGSCLDELMCAPTTAPASQPDTVILEGQTL